MATFVLVHGVWHGGWCWQKVIPFLEEEAPLPQARSACVDNSPFTKT